MNSTQGIQNLVGKIVTIILDPLMALLLGAGLVVFMWGLVQFIWGFSSETGISKEQGKQHMLWGIIGMAVMACAFGLLALIANTVCGGSASSASGISSSCGF